MNSKILYIIFILSVITMFLIMFFSCLLIFSTEINESLEEIEGTRTVLIILLFRVAITSFLSFITFLKWFKQEKQYINDIPFLLGFFFLFLVFGKLWDIIVYFTYFTIDDKTYAIILKIRFLLIVFGFIPMIFLSILLILFLRSINKEGSVFKDNKTRNRITVLITSIILSFETALVLLFFSNTVITSSISPFLVIPPLIMITWLFIFVYKQKRLSQVHALILAIGFLTFMISQIAYTIMLNSLGFTASTVLISDLFVISSLIIIFIGLIKKPNYKKNLDEN